MSRVFISHASADKERFARRLAEDLRYKGHDVWFDEWTIKPGESLAERIDQGIQGCDYFIIVISRKSLSSRWVQQELNSAVVREIERRTTLVIPILLGAIRLQDIPVSLRAKRYIDMCRVTERNYARGFAELMSTLGDTSDLGQDDIPIFSCPRCSTAEVDQLRDVHMSVIDIICLENTVEMGWSYERLVGEAHLVFRQEGRASRPIQFALDSTDRDRLTDPSAKAEIWRLFARPNDQNGILKLQYRVRRRHYVALYWINYAIGRHIESRLREFCHDWDFEVTLGQVDL